MIAINWLNFFIGFLLLLSVMPIHELCHWIPAKIMGLNPSFDILKGKFRVQAHYTNERQALIVGLMPIPFVAMLIFMSLFFLTDYTGALHNKELCLIFMIGLSVVSSIMISISDLKVLYAIIH